MDRLDLHILKHLMLLTIKDYALVLFESLYVEANEPPLDLRRLKLTLQYIVKLKANIDNPAYNCVFHPLCASLS